jgi:hypothetical protein
MYRAGPVSAPRWEPQNRHWPSAALGVNAILTIPMPVSAIGILESRASDACLDCCSGRRLAGPSPHSQRFNHSSVTLCCLANNDPSRR